MYNRDIFEGMHSMIRSMVIGKDRSRRVVVEEKLGVGDTYLIDGRFARGQPRADPERLD